MAISSEPRPTAGLVLVRVAAGLLLVRSAWIGLSDGSPTGAEIRDRVEAALPDVSGISRWWAESILLENPDAIAFLWRWLILATGAGLVLGALTRPLGAIAAVLMVNAWVFGTEAAQLLHLLLAICCIACVVSRAGRTAGLDLVLDPILPTWLTWAPKPKRGW